MTPTKRSSKSGGRQSLIRGRPPLARTKGASISAKATRSVIRSHHELNKAFTQALVAGNHDEAERIQGQLSAQGGLASYQAASTLGQSSDRGGDTSKVLVDWLATEIQKATQEKRVMQMLEIGALSTRNACSKVSCIDVRRIDLHSQEAGIEEIDFMELPQPGSDDARLSIISLSLVLNFVPDAAARGIMLQRLPSFMLTRESGPDTFLPCLFIVLPLPCVSNSRYLDETLLRDILESLGFVLLQIKKTSKLWYSLWRYAAEPRTRETAFKKRQIRTGTSRNNFAIVLK